MIETKKLSGTASCLRLLMATSALLLAPATAIGQTAQPAPTGEAPIGPPQLRDFQLPARQQIVTQPTPTAAPSPAPTQRATNAQPAQQQPTQTQRTAPAATTTRAGPTPAPTPTPSRDLPPAPRAPVTAAPAVPTPDATPAPAPVESAPPAAIDTAPLPRPSEAQPAPATTTQAPAPVEAPADGGLPMWLILLGGLGIGLAGYAVFARRRAAQRRADALPAPEMVAAAPVPQGPRAPRPDPVPRPWLEIELKPERTTADPEESIVEFEMTIRNNGGSPARNVKLQAKLVCSTPDQDKEIAAFHRKKPGEHRTLDVPDLQAGEELVLKGRVDVKREDLKALRVEQRLLFVPLVAVNAFYDFGNARSGQTSKSFLVGRERADSVEKMAPFRLDLGPRVYRTLGQRPYKIERRV